MVIGTPTNTIRFQDYRVFCESSRLVCTDAGQAPSPGQALSDLIFPGEEVQFEAAQDEMTKDNRFCSWRANVVWKGRDSKSFADLKMQEVSHSLPIAEDPKATRPNLQLPAIPAVANVNPAPDPAAFFNGWTSDSVVSGIGMVGKVINDKTGLIWWVRSKSNLFSVVFESKKAFMYGENLAEKRLFDVFQEGKTSK